MSETQAIQLSDAQRETYDVLVSMGFATEHSLNVAQTFGASTQEAINHLLDANSPMNDQFAVTVDNQFHNIGNDFRVVENPFDVLDNPYAFLDAQAPNQDIEPKPFRINHLSELFISGYFHHLFSGSNQHRIFPSVVQHIILEYFTFLFVKLQYHIDPQRNGKDDHKEDNENDMHYLAFDEDITLGSIALSIEKDHVLKAIFPAATYPQFVRLWIRFPQWQGIYHTDYRYRDPFKDCGIVADCNDCERWTALPADYEHIKVNDMDKMLEERDQFVEIAVERHRGLTFPFTDKQTFHEDELMIGDIVDVFSDKHKEWFESFIKDIGVDRIGVHLIGLPKDCDMELARNECAQRGTHTNGPCRDWRKALYVGSAVDCFDDQYNKWYSASVNELCHESHALGIHYDGYSTNYDELIPIDSDRLDKLHTHTQPDPFVSLTSPP